MEVQQAWRQASVEVSLVEWAEAAAVEQELRVVAVADIAGVETVVVDLVVDSILVAGCIAAEDIHPAVVADREYSAVAEVRLQSVGSH